MGFASKGVWVMGYHSCMSYEALFPANQLGGLKNVWNLREYGVCEPWVMRESTVWPWWGTLWWLTWPYNMLYSLEWLLHFGPNIMDIWPWWGMLWWLTQPYNMLYSLDQSTTPNSDCAIDLDKQAHVRCLEVAYVQMQKYPLRQKVTCNITCKPKHNIESVGLSNTLSKHRQYPDTACILSAFHIPYTLLIPFTQFPTHWTWKRSIWQLLNASTRIEDTLEIGP